MKNTAISWTNDTWNPWIGCKRVSEGCTNCYMFRERKRFGGNGKDIRRTKEASFYAPLKSLKGPFVFVCSWSDFFLPEADEWRDEAWRIMRQCDHLTFQILTKRPENIHSCLPKDWMVDGFGYKNVWIGVSAENQNAVDERLPLLMKEPAIVRFVSLEPLLGEVDLKPWIGLIDWVIVGGESGPKARPMRQEWVNAILCECKRYNLKVPFFFKQWGGTKRINGSWGGDDFGALQWKEYPLVF